MAAEAPRRPRCRTATRPGCWTSGPICMRSHGDPEPGRSDRRRLRGDQHQRPGRRRGSGAPVWGGPLRRRSVQPVHRRGPGSVAGRQPVPPPPDQAELIKYTDCMRANGVPNYPDPTANHDFPGHWRGPQQPAGGERQQTVRHRASSAWLVDQRQRSARRRLRFQRRRVRTRESPACFYQASGCPSRPGAATGGRVPMAEFSARRVVAIAAVAGALVGGAVAGGVAVAATSGNGNSPTSSSGASSSVATAAVVRTTLTNTVQVGGSIGYRRLLHRRRPVGGERPAGRPGPAGGHRGPADPVRRRAGRIRRVDRRQPGDRGRPDQRRRRPVHPQLRPGQEDQGLRREGGVHAGVQPGRPEGQPGPDSADPGRPAAGDGPVERDR